MSSPPAAMPAVDVTGLSAGGSDDTDEDEDVESGEVEIVDEEEEEDVDEEEAEALRALANSPRGDSTHLVPGTSDETGSATPNTLRNEYDVNSPRKKEAHSGWSGAKADDDDAEADGSGPPPGFITQVQKPGTGGVESLVTQVPRPDAEDVEADLADVTGGSGSWGLLDCLMCCGSPPDAATKVSAEMGAAAKKKAGGTKMPSASRQQLMTAAGGASGTEPSGGGGDESDSEAPAGLLPPMLPEHKGRKCLVLDLDETLVHSSFKPVATCDFIIPVEIEGVVHRVYVLKRPFVDEFLVEVAKHYEVVIFTASLAKYADPLLDRLDTHKTIAHRLFRDSCVLHGSAYVKDLSKLGRKMRQTIIVDNSPNSYIFQPDHAVPIASWFDDPRDTQLKDFIPVLETTLKDVYDVSKILDANTKSFRWLCNQAGKPASDFQ